MVFIEIVIEEGYFSGVRKPEMQRINIIVRMLVLYYQNLILE